MGLNQPEDLKMYLEIFKFIIPTVLKIVKDRPLEVNFSDEEIKKVIGELDDKWKAFFFQDLQVGNLIDKIRNRENINNHFKAQLNFVDHKGIMFLGKSGVGKTSLINALIKNQIIPAKESTYELQRIYTTIFNQVTCIRDTFGRSFHNLKGNLIKECIKDPPKIVCLVFADSFLESIGDKRFHREDKDYKNITKYLEETREEEISWVKQITKDIEVEREFENGKSGKIKYVQDVFIIVNKMDLWCNDISKYRDVEKYYKEHEEIKKLVSLLVGPKDHYPTFLGVSSAYENFMGGEVNCIQGFNKNVSRFSIIVLRASISDKLSK